MTNDLVYEYSNFYSALQKLFNARLPSRRTQYLMRPVLHAENPSTRNINSLTELNVED